MEQLREIIIRFPLVPALAVYLAYVGYDYYGFRYGEGQAYAQKVAELEKVKKGNADDQKSLRDAKQFFATLQQKRDELRALAKELDQMKGVVTEDIDIAGFTKVVLTESRRVGLNTLSIRPEKEVEDKFYTEQPFTFEFRGLYAQLLVFMERLAAIERIVRIDDFQIKSRGSTGQFTELEGKLTIKTYRYKGSPEDELARAGGSTSAAPAPGAGAAKPAAGAPPAQPVKATPGAGA